MAVRIDFSNDDVIAALKRAQAQGFMSYEELNSILGEDISPDDIEDTINVILEMGIRLIEHVTQEEQDADDIAYFEARSAFQRQGGMMTLTPDGWMKYARGAMLKRKRRTRKS